MKLHRRAFNSLLAATGLTAATGALSSAQAAKQVDVSIDQANSRFKPATITISAGDTVTWTNPGIVTHTVTFDPKKAIKASDVVLPAGAQPFDSGDMQEDAEFSHTFTAKGTYKYVCKYHEPMGMIGTVIVN